MRSARQLRLEELECLVEQLQEILYRDVCGLGNADKEHDSDALGAIDTLLCDLGLKPELCPCAFCGKAQVTAAAGLRMCRRCARRVDRNLP
jgi:hypothetical protein